MNHRQPEPRQSLKTGGAAHRPPPKITTGTIAEEQKQPQRPATESAHTPAVEPPITSGGHMGTARQQHPELMEVEFIGGPFDGTRLELRIVRVGERDICVLKHVYEPMFAWTKASEVESVE